MSVTYTSNFMIRHYNPDTGRFLSEDPIGFGSGDENFYRYVGNKPNLYTDPNGKTILLPILIGIMIIYPELIGDEPAVFEPTPNLQDRLRPKPKNWEDYLEDIINDIDDLFNPRKTIVTKKNRCA